MGTDPDDVTCGHCGRRGTAAEARLGWSLDVPPRPTGSTAPARNAEAAHVCAQCTRLLVRDVEARLDL